MHYSIVDNLIGIEYGVIIIFGVHRSPFTPKFICGINFATASLWMQDVDYKKTGAFDHRCLCLRKIFCITGQPIHTLGCLSGHGSDNYD